MRHRVRTARTAKPIKAKPSAEASIGNVAELE